ncbi:MAG: glycosyltransferase [Elusimicrobiota bacterium]|nr:glycosyltransferase [Elusimicrobiota bacterium]
MNKTFIAFHLDDGKELRGGQRQTLLLAKELNKSGHRNIIVCRKNSPLEKAVRAENIEILNLPYIFEWDILSALILKREIKKTLTGEDKEKTAILHSHTSHTAGLSYLVSLFMKVIRIVHRRVDFKVKKRLSTRLKYLKADNVIALSKAIKKILIEGGVNETKVSIIASSADINNVPWTESTFNDYKKKSKKEISEKFSINKDSFWIGSLMALVPHKDPENFLTSAKKVLEKFPETNFILAGKGELSDTLKTLALKLNIQDKFHIIGYQNESYKILAALDLFVLSSKEEGLGSVLINAMNAKLPVAATDAGGITDLIEDKKNGLIAPKENAQELANAQIKLIEDKNLRVALAEKNYKRRINFSSKKMAEATVKIYEKTIKNT